MRKDYIEYLQPIIEDVKDNKKTNLTKNDVDYIINIIRAKIEFHENLISLDEYEKIIYSL